MAPISDPMTAVRSAPPTCRLTSFTADAAPDVSSGTEPITDSVAGRMTQPVVTAEAKNQAPRHTYAMPG